MSVDSRYVSELEALLIVARDRLVAIGIHRGTDLHTCPDCILLERINNALGKEA